MKHARIAWAGAIHDAVEAHGQLLLASGRRLSFDEVVWLPPLAPVPRPRTILALGLNYADHARELAFKAPDEPLAFVKGENALTGHRAYTTRPAGVGFMHYECELVVVVGRAARNIRRDDARDFICGYSVANDYAIRDYLETAPCLAFGNTAVLKMSELSPLSAARLGELALEAGIPAGVLNLVHGYGADAGEPLCRHPDVRAISFTGSTATGNRIVKAAGLKKFSMELGGKSPFVVFDDADLARALDAAVFMIFSNNGERCTAGSRILVQQSVYADFAQKLAERARRIRVGDPLDENTIVGPMISPAHLAKVRSYIELGPKEGATLLCGGLGAPDLPDRVRRGNYVLPTVFADVDNRMRIAQEEIFGPVACLIPFKDEADAIRLANDIAYGLSSYVWTENIGRAHRVAAAVEAGMCFVNSEYHINCAPDFQGTYTSNELPHFIKNMDYAYPGNPALGHLIADAANALGVKSRAHSDTSLGLEYGSLVPMRYMNADKHYKVVSVSGWCVWHDLRESARFGLAVRNAIEQHYDGTVAILASGSLSHHFANNGSAPEFMHKVWDPFLEQVDRRVVELWERGDWKTFCAMLPMYNEKCWGEGGMHDTAMLLGALGWDRYRAPAEVVTPYFGSSGTGQINAVFPVTPLHT